MSPRGPYPQAPWTALIFPILASGHMVRGMSSRPIPDKVVLQRSGIALPYFATKTVRLLDQRSIWSSLYMVENRGSAPFRYLWSAHPLISVPCAFAGSKLPPGNLSFRTFPADGKVRPWPMYKGTDLSSHWIPQGTNLKIFVSGMTEGWCALHLPSHLLRFTFDPQCFPSSAFGSTITDLRDRARRIPLHCRGTMHLAVGPARRPGALRVSGAASRRDPRTGRCGWISRARSSPEAE